MATVLNTYKVLCHFETGGKRNGVDYIHYVQATASDYTTIKTVMSNNSSILGVASGSVLKPGTLVIDSIQEVGHGDIAVA